jgi:hypothetical protein
MAIVEVVGSGIDPNDSGAWRSSNNVDDAVLVDIGKVGECAEGANPIDSVIRLQRFNLLCDRRVDVFQKTMSFPFLGVRKDRELYLQPRLRSALDRD